MSFSINYSNIISLLIHTVILTSAVMIYIFIENERKEISILSVLFSIIAIPSVYIIENYSKTSIKFHQNQINYALFSYYRSIYYYFLIKTINIYFNKKNIHFIKIIYFLFIIYNFSLSYLILIGNINETFYHILSRLTHYISYIMKPLPYILSFYLVIKKSKKIRVFDIIFLLLSLVCFFSVVLSMYFFKYIKPHFNLLMELNSVLFIVYIELILCYKIVEDRDSADIIKRNYIQNLNNSIHSLGHQLEFISKKLTKDEQYSLKTTFKTIKDIRKNISDIDLIRLSQLNTTKFMNYIIDNYFFDYEDNILLNSEYSYTINTDKEKLDTIIMNLIKNAIEYLEKNKIDILININIIKYKKGLLIFKKEYIKFNIIHQGNISQNISEIIYEQGFSTKGSETNNSGTGLFHSRQLADKMGGSLTHQSKNNKVDFCLEIPAN